MEPLTSGKNLLYRRLIIGSTIAFIWTAIFLYTGGAFDPQWPKFWYFRPLILVPAAGAIGGLFYHFFESYRQRSKWWQVGINIFCVLVYIAGVWIATILGLDGVWWD